MTAARYDAVILGGGPAGCAAALSLLRRGHSAAIVEASGYAAERVGESLPPPVRGVLEELGVWETFQRCGRRLDAYATSAAWGTGAPQANPFALSGAGTGWQVDRRQFDALLAAAARSAGTAVHVRARLGGAERTPHGWRLAVTREHAAPLRLDAPIVVDAGGRRARFASAQGVRKLVEDRLVGVCGVFDGAMAAHAGLLVEACREGWWYSAPLPGDRAVVAFLSDADIVSATGVAGLDGWCAALARREHTLGRLDGAGWPTRLSVHNARTQRLDTIAGADWLAAGDAAATVDPLSSQGVLKALRGGTFAGYAVADRLAGRAHALERYATLVAGEHDDDLAARALHYAHEQRWPTAPFWRRRHAAPSPPERPGIARAVERIGCSRPAAA